MINLSIAYWAGFFLIIFGLFWLKFGFEKKKVISNVAFVVALLVVVFVALTQTNNIPAEQVDLPEPKLVDVTPKSVITKENLACLEKKEKDLDNRQKQDYKDLAKDSETLMDKLMKQRKVEKKGVTLEL